MTKYELFGLLGSTISFLIFAFMMINPVVEVPFPGVMNTIFAYSVLAVTVLILLYALKRWFDYSKLFVALIGYLLFGASMIFIVGEVLNVMFISNIGVFYVLVASAPFGLIFALLEALVVRTVEAQEYTVLYLMPLLVVLGTLIWTLCLGLLHKAFIVMKVKYYGR